MKNIMHSKTGLIVILAIFIVFSLLSARLFNGVRFDLTEGQLYTLTDETQKILSELDSPVTLKLYFSEKATAELPGLRTYAHRIKELLDEYATLADGKLTVSFVDPIPFSEEEDEASAAGLQGVPVGIRGDEIFFGLVGTNDSDGEEVISFFQPDKEQFVEYELTKLIYNLSNPELPVVGIISGVNINGGFDYMTQQRQPAWVVMQQMEDLFDVRPLAEDIDAIDAEVDILLLVHPKDLSEQTLFAIDQFVMKGGRTLVFVDPFAEADIPPAPMAATASRRSDLSPLFAEWGIALQDAHIVGDFINSLVVNMGGGRNPVRHIGLLGLDLGAFNDQDVVMAGLESINLSSVGILDTVEGATTQVVPLIQSSIESQPLEADRLKALQNPESLMESFTPTGKQYTLAARITGAANSAFPEGVEVEERQVVEEEPGVPEAEPVMVKRLLVPDVLKNDNINVIVVADTDILSDRLWVQVQQFFGQRVVSPWADNAGFLINALENLAGNEDLINIRSRGRFSRPFTKVEELRRHAEEQFLAQQQVLQEQLEQTEAKLLEMEQIRGGGDSAILSEEQALELARFQDEKIKIRKELRDVQHQLDRDIESLGTELKMINIFLVPLLLTLLLVLMRFIRKRVA
ncbi:GldG family protein [Alkalimarinus alittae]|uniref:Gldg family protein n=1 Tax=Alkalimarinus alittae TaxID=2961619 RepID=A0ABY6N585_9ALTE|nr:Gldg family protein [Alkalimarinus alittae]UZE97142.1 Gldg family protein [Alkalimarinus alittae]